MIIKANTLIHSKDCFWSGMMSANHVCHGFDRPSHWTSHCKSYDVHLEIHWVHAVDEGPFSQIGNTQDLCLTFGLVGTISIGLVVSSSSSFWFSPLGPASWSLAPPAATPPMPPVNISNLCKAHFVQIEIWSLIQNPCGLFQFIFHIYFKLFHEFGHQYHIRKPEIR